jgi:two-component system, cell cycle sensor histidine kinase and response regulator CckA
MEACVPPDPIPGQSVDAGLFRVLVEHAPLAIGLNRNGRVLYVNPAARALLGFSPSFDATDLPVPEVFVEADRTAVAERIARRTSDERQLEAYEARLQSADGTAVPVRVVPVWIGLPDGPAVAAFMSDMREREAAHEAYRSSELRYHRLVEQASEAIVVMDDSGRYVDVNAATCQLLGYDRDELLAMTPVQLIDERDLARLETALDRVAAGQLVRGEFRFRRKEGSVVEVDVSAGLLPDGHIQAVGRDITERTATDAERSRLVAAVDQSRDAIALADAKGRAVYVNHAFAVMTGLKPEEVLGRRSTEAIGERQPAATSKAIDTAREQHTSFSGPVRIQRPDGGSIDLELVITPLRDGAGEPMGFVEIGRDVTQERALEAQLNRAQKMEAVGRLAGGIAHDFNNLLTAIKGYAELLGQGLASGSPDPADLAEIRRAAERAGELTRQLLAFARRTRLEPTIIDLNEALADAEPMLRRFVPDDVELVVRHEPELGRVLADPSELERVLTNLVVNAIDAMPTGGTLTIETFNVAPGEAPASGLTGESHGAVAVAVSDTGVGIPPEEIDHIFEPFFSTKEPGHGTGLGLATVFGIVEQSNGRVSVQSAPGRGTRFTVCLPRVEADRGAALSELSATRTTRRGNETILVVEDEPSLRHLARRLLEGRGYRVVSADNATDALEIAATFGHPIHLLFTDVVMPHLRGPELAARLRRMRPGLPVVYTSGYAHEHEDHPPADGLFIAKPYAAEELFSVVRDALDGPSAERTCGRGRTSRRAVISTRQQHPCWLSSLADRWRSTCFRVRAGLAGSAELHPTVGRGWRGQCRQPNHPASLPIHPPAGRARTGLP